MKVEDSVFLSVFILEIDYFSSATSILPQLHFSNAFLKNSYYIFQYSNPYEVLL